MLNKLIRKILKCAVSAALVTAICAASAGTVYSNRVFRDISDNVVRLHVLANSDSEQDQLLKLKVRDAVVKYAEKSVKDCGSPEEMINFLEDNSEQIKAVAEDCLRKEGSTYAAYVCVGEYDFPSKNYGKYCFPAGKYNALRVVIGEGEGKNWWCVLFPPLCYVSENAVSVSEDAEKSLRKNLSEEAFDTIDGEEADGEDKAHGDVSDFPGIDDGVKVTYKFKIVEIFRKVISFFSD